MSDSIGNREPSPLGIRFDGDGSGLRELLVDAGPGWDVSAGVSSVMIVNFFGTPANVRTLVETLRSWIAGRTDANVSVVFQGQVLEVAGSEYTRLEQQLLGLAGGGGTHTQIVGPGAITMLGVETANVHVYENRETPRAHQRPVGATGDSGVVPPDNATLVVPVTVYLADGREPEPVIDAIERWLSGAGLDITASNSGRLSRMSVCSLVSWMTANPTAGFLTTRTMPTRMTARSSDARRHPHRAGYDRGIAESGDSFAPRDQLTL